MPVFFYGPYQRNLSHLMHLFLTDMTGIFYQCLNRFIFINAPSFFASIWHLVRPLVDPHTASKVDIFASKKVWQARLLDLIGADHLPSDYGGTAPPQVERFLKLTKEKYLRRQVTYPIFLRFSWSVALFDFVLNGEDDMMELLVLTKTQKVCSFSVIKQDASGNELVQVAEVKHILIGDEHPTRFKFPQLLDSPGNVRRNIQPVSFDEAAYADSHYLFFCSLPCYAMSTL
jgi:hypothetical protein